LVFWSYIFVGYVSWGVVVDILRQHYQLTQTNFKKRAEIQGQYYAKYCIFAKRKGRFDKAD
jgi:hypothetical protein